MEGGFLTSSSQAATSMSQITATSARRWAPTDPPCITEQGSVSSSTHAAAAALVSHTDGEGGEQVCVVKHGFLWNICTDCQQHEQPPPYPATIKSQ
jgi:CubicO group peptidase (beta-lactamase class C family)